MPRHFYITIALILTIASCSPSFHTGTRKEIVVEQLFFGRNLNGRQVVSDSAWTNFLAEVVTPLFPDGFTAWPATGQWRGASGLIEQEASFVLELVHPPSSIADSDITVIITTYKQRFQQEAVLRVIMPGRCSFGD
ncbi:DUF3574 domain-containing protein [bacterium]|nr:DUF3574 domain-containing protein [bacterium]